MSTYIENLKASGGLMADLNLWRPSLRAAHAVMQAPICPAEWAAGLAN